MAEWLLKNHNFPFLDAVMGPRYHIHYLCCETFHGSVLLVSGVLSSCVACSSVLSIVSVACI